MAPSYALLTSVEDLRALVGQLIAESLPVGLDIETGYDGDSRVGGSLHPEENFVVSIQFTNSLSWARCVPLRFDAGVNVDNEQAAEIFWDLVTATDAEGLPLCVAHGAKFEMRSLARWFLRYLAKHPQLGEAAIAVHGYFKPRSCTLLESYVEAKNRGHALKDITWQNFKHKQRELLELFPEGLTKKEQDSIRFNVLDQNNAEVVAYACEDAVYTLAHHLRRYPKLKDSLIYKIEMNVLTEVVCDMEDVGIAYDWNLMREGALKGREFADKYQVEVLAGFSELAGETITINLGSPPQLADVLYTKCGMPVSRWTDGGKKGIRKPSTDAKTALKGLSKQYPEVRRLLNWKGLRTLCNNFLEKYERDFSYAADGRAHPNLLQHGTITGRTSANGPNYQQSPKKYHYELASGEAYDFNFRDSLVSPSAAMRLWWEIMLEELGVYTPPVSDVGWYLIGYDYSQIELRVIAGEAGETALLEAFGRGEDVHTLTASRMLGKPMEAITPEERDDVGKRMNFALGYGLTPEGLADQMGIPIEEAEDLFTQYHAAYPHIKQWSERTIAASKRNGFVTTTWGRVVPIWEYDDADKLPHKRGRAMRREGERTAGNAPIQGSATGDYKKAAMVRAKRALRKAGLDDKVHLVMDVHDALYFYARLDVAPQDIIAVLQPAVVFPVTGWPPIVADWSIGQRWGTMHKLELLDDGTVRVVKKKEQAAPVAEVTGDEDELPAVNRELLRSARGGGHVLVAGQQAGEGRVGGVPPVSAEVEPVVAHVRDRNGAVVGGVHAAGDSGGVVRTVNISLPAMPGIEEAKRLVEFLHSLPGQNQVHLLTPEGVVGTGQCGLTPEHEPQVSMLLGLECLVFYIGDSVDSEALTAGVVF